MAVTSIPQPVMHSRSSEARSSFPFWVALCSLATALVLFFFNTAPALEEQRQLREVAEEVSDLKRRYEDAIRDARFTVGSRLDYDLQSLLVAIDQHGYTPLELCMAYPERLVPAPQPEDPTLEPGPLPEADDAPAGPSDGAVPAVTPRQETPGIDPALDPANDPDLRRTERPLPGSGELRRDAAQGTPNGRNPR
jgi:hypothetical protein